jgi:hypothetical protein
MVAAFAALLCAAWFLLEGNARLIVMILLGWFLVRSLLAHFKPE